MIGVRLSDADRESLEAEHQTLPFGPEGRHGRIRPPA